MLKLMAVCTGNICRSPLAEALLRTRLVDLDVVTSSAGTRARDGSPMTAQTVALASAMDIPPERAVNHAARLLNPQLLSGVDLVLAMGREHRRDVVEMQPSAMRRAFTIREFARLAGSCSDADFVEVAAGAALAETSRSERFAAALALLAARRGVVPPPESPSDDDVVDPYRRSTATYERALREMLPGLAAVERVVRLVCSASR